MSKDKTKGVDAFERGRRKGHCEGYEYAMNSILYVMQDKYNWDSDDMVRLNAQLEGVNVAILMGNITYTDIKNVLRDEYDIEFGYITKKELEAMEKKKEKPKKKNPEEIREELLQQLKNRYARYD